MKGSKLHEALSANHHEKCAKYLRAIGKKKTIALEAIGSRSNNQLLDLLKCESKFSRQECKNLHTVYAICHASVMGTGSYNGHKDCKSQLQPWFECVVVVDANSEDS